MIGDYINSNMDEVWNNSFELLAIVDRQGRMLLQNENWERILGNPDLESKAGTLLELVNPDDRQSINEAFFDLYAGSPERSFACRFKTADGDYQLFQLTCRLFSDVILITGKDLIKNIMLQNLLFESERNSNLIIRHNRLKEELVDLQMKYDAIPYAVFTVNHSNIITSWNRRAELITGYTKAEMIGKSCDHVLDPSDTLVFMKPDVEPEPVQNYSGVLRTKGGASIPINRSIDVYRDNDGIIKGMIEAFYIRQEDYNPE